MSTPKFFFRIDGDDAFCYNLKHFKAEIRKEYDEISFEIPTHIMLREAKISFGDGTFYCKEYGEVGLVDQSECGSGCEKYDPRNGRSGRCRHSSSCYEPAGRIFTLTKTKDNVKLIEMEGINHG